MPTDEAVHGVWGLSDDLAYASTEESGEDPYDENRLLGWNGSAWSVAALQPNARKWDVWAPAEERVFTAGGAGGSMVLWDGVDATLGGNLFVDETTSLLGQAMAIRGFGEWSIFVAGMNGAIARHFGSEQSTWQNGACYTLDDEPFAYWGAYDCDYIRAPLGNWDLGGSFPDDVYVVGEHAKMARFDGTDWSLVADLPTQHSLNGVWSSCAGDLFAVGDFGTILRRQGSTWTRMGSPTAEHLTAVAGFSPSDVYAVGYGGTILHFDGTTWSPEASETDNTLEDIGVGGSTVWAVGARQDEVKEEGPGTILRKQRALADATAPRNPLLRSGAHPPGEWTPDADLRVELEGGCDDGRGIEGYSVVLDHEPATVPAAVQNLDREASHFAQTVADGEWWLHLRTVDRAGNWSGASHLGLLRVDTTPPSEPTVTTDPEAGTWSAATNAEVSWSGAADPASGVAGYSYSADQSPDGMADITADVAGSATGATVPVGMGDWYVHVRTVDAAGNWSDGVTAGPLHIDGTPPENATATSTSHQPFVPSSDNTIDVALSGASDLESGVAGFSYAFDQTPPVQPDEVVDAGWQTQAVTSPPLADGEWWFHLRTVNQAGVWSGHNAIGPFQIDSSPGPPSIAPTLPPALPLPDTTPPPARLAGSTTQRLGSSARVEVHCTGTEDCLVEANGVLSVPDVAKTYRLSRVSARRIAAGHKATLKLKLSRRARAAARRALRAQREVTVRVTVVVRDAAGNPRTLHWEIRLRR